MYRNKRFFHFIHTYLLSLTAEVSAIEQERVEIKAIIEKTETEIEAAEAHNDAKVVAVPHLRTLRVLGGS